METPAVYKKVNDMLGGMYVVLMRVGFLCIERGRMCVCVLPPNREARKYGAPSLMCALPSLLEGTYPLVSFSFLVVLTGLRVRCVGCLVVSVHCLMFLSSHASPFHFQDLETMRFLVRVLGSGAPPIGLMCRSHRRGTKRRVRETSLRTAPLWVNHARVVGGT